MTHYFPKRLLIGIGLYLLVGLLVGSWMISDFAAEDRLIAESCSSTSDCWRLNAPLLPALMVIWPLWILSSPLIVAVAFVIVFAGWSGVRAWQQHRGNSLKNAGRS